jgi:hypothetical protein
MKKELLYLLPLLIILHGCSDSKAESSPAIVTVEPQAEAEAEAEAETETETDITFQTIHNGMWQISGSSNKSITLTSNQIAYEQALADRTTEVPENINFEQSMVVFLDVGTRTSGGYDISISSIVDDENYVTATVVLTIPSEGCPVTNAITNFFTVVKIDTRKEVLFTEQLQRTNC